MRALLASVWALALVGLTQPLSAQDFPSRPIKLIIPFAAGGPADIIGRVVAQKMADLLGQPVIVDSRGGAGGVIGTDVVAKSAPDGYTIVLTSAGALAISASLQEKVPYNATRDFTPISLVGTVPEVLVVAPKLQVNSVAGLIALAKSQPGKINFASSGPGSMPHLAGELLKIVTKTDMTHVPYRGAAPAVNDLLGNQVETMFADMPVLLPHIEAGTLKALAIGSTQRSPALPNVPTLAEQGFPNVTAENWYGIVAAAGTPAPIVIKLHTALVKTLKDSDVKDKLGRQGVILAGNSPDEFAAYIRSEIVKWAEVVKASGAKAN